MDAGYEEPKISEFLQGFGKDVESPGQAPHTQGTDFPPGDPLLPAELMSAPGCLCPCGPWPVGMGC